MLLVEDDEVDRLAVRRALAKTDFHPQLSEAHDCNQARAMLRQETIDCVLLDVYLPDGDGVAEGLGEDAAGTVVGEGASTVALASIVIPSVGDVPADMSAED